ncbi:MAG: hypothetical protein MR492_04575 [Clostridiales bacterium]|nr:hypothetical protein [Clostridiales bacterium]MDD6540025.1 hypothetical protein [Bacillota bacterium]MDD7016050.1 hypothetical protein [Bacillota bacterium]MDY4958675.1 hypothetical protein [Lentihominibacter sp.]
MLLKVFNLHEAMHADSGICLWTLLAFIIFLIIVALAIIHFAFNKKRDNEARREIEEMRKAKGDVS